MSCWPPPSRTARRRRW
ncbi:MAG: hypothetical protein IPF77_09020 [Gemmatimonadetes bacterium]|nr:hypothetical protein [Gemmatimonadota bacterium]